MAKTMSGIRSADATIRWIMADADLDQSIAESRIAPFVTTF
jgi:hypothetical protein